MFYIPNIYFFSFFDIYKGSISSDIGRNMRDMMSLLQPYSRNIYILPNTLPTYLHGQVVKRVRMRGLVIMGAIITLALLLSMGFGGAV